MYSPQLRFSTVTECLSHERINFSPASLISPPPSQPWKLLSTQELNEHYSHHAASASQQPFSSSQESNDEVVSVGSWLSMDSQNLTTKVSNQSQQLDSDQIQPIFNQFLLSVKQYD